MRVRQSMCVCAGSMQFVCVCIERGSGWDHMVVGGWERGVGQDANGGA